MECFCSRIQILYIILMTSGVSSKTTGVVLPRPNATSLLHGLASWLQQRVMHLTAGSMKLTCNYHRWGSNAKQVYSQSRNNSLRNNISAVIYEILVQTISCMEFKRHNSLDVILIRGQNSSAACQINVARASTCNLVEYDFRFYRQLEA